jgi:drug/metabolite transporter (DMT)-like permease
MEKSPSRAGGTALGLIAALLWSGSIAFSRITSEAFGYITVAAIIYSSAGLISCALAYARGDLLKIVRLPKLYLIGCGALMPLYTVSYYAAIGLATGHAETIEVGLINYLWPALVVAFSVPLLGLRWRWTLIPGILAGFAGVVVAALDTPGFALTEISESMAQNLPAYGFSLICAVAWALYSNLNRRWGNADWPSPMPVLMLATGIILWIIRIFHHEEMQPTPLSIAAVMYSIIFPTMLAYTFWDVAMRRGNFVIVSSASYLTPILSTVISVVLLSGSKPGWLLWAGAVLVVIGAVTSKLSLREN